MIGRNSVYPTDFKNYVSATDSFDFAPYNYLLTPSERVGAFLNFKQALGDDINLRAKLVYNHRHSTTEAAFLPLFIDPKAHQGIATFAALAGIILVVSIAYCSMLIGVGNLARRRLIQHPRISDALRRVAGLFLVGFGIRLGLNG